MGIDFNSKEPIYIQIAAHMKKRILSGEIKEGEKMPSVREYATELKVNPNTVQRVYTELEESELIYTQRGIGKFVTKEKDVIDALRIELSRELVERFIQDTKELGLQKKEIIDLINDRF